MGFFGPEVIQNKKMSNFATQIIIKKFNLHFVSNEGEFRGHFKFFNLNLLVSSFYFRSNKLTQINHVIVNILSGRLIVTVNI